MHRHHKDLDSILQRQLVNIARKIPVPCEEQRVSKSEPESLGGGQASTGDIETRKKVREGAKLAKADFKQPFEVLTVVFISIATG